MQKHRELIRGEYDASSVAREIVDVAVDKKAADVSLIDIGKVTTLADYFVIATGTSDRQIGAIARAIEERLDEPDGRDLVADISRVRAELGYAPRIGLRDGLQHYLDCLARADG